MRKALPVMMGLGSAFSGKMSPELARGIADSDEEGDRLVQAIQAKETSKLPMGKMPKQLQKLIKEGKVKKEDFREV